MNYKIYFLKSGRFYVMGNSTSKLTDPREWRIVQVPPTFNKQEELEILDPSQNKFGLFKNALDLIRSMGSISPILLDRIARVHQKLVSLLQRETLKGLLSRTAFDLLRCGSINMCSFASFEDVIETLGPTHPHCMRCVQDVLPRPVTVASSSSSSSLSWKTVDWEADLNTYIFRTNLVYHQLPKECTNNSFEQLIKNEFMHCNQLSNFRYTLLLLNSSLLEEENCILNFLFGNNLFSLPSVPFGTIIPTCLFNNETEIVNVEYVNLFTAKLIKLSDGKMIIELSPFLKLLIMLRIELLANNIG